MFVMALLSRVGLKDIFCGKVFDPKEALEGGLIRSIHAQEDLIPVARQIAREIIDNTAPVSIALSRQMILRMAGAKHPMDAHKIDSRGIFARGRMSDAKEGVERASVTYSQEGFEDADAEA